MKPSIIFYGAGKNAKKHLAEWIEQGYEPVCFVDADVSKQHTLFPGSPYEILPLIEAITRYPEYELYLTLNGLNLLEEVRKSLLVLNIPENRIKVFTNTHLRRGCHALDNGIVVNAWSIASCCEVYFRTEQKYSDAIHTHDSIVEAVSNWLNWREKTRKQLILGESSDCDGCPNLKYDAFEESPKITNINAGPGFLGSVCNCRCIYCNQQSTVFGAKSKQSLDSYELHRIIMEEFPDTIDISYVTLADGEITVLPYRDKLLDLVLSKDCSAAIGTNAIIYNEKVARVLNRKGSKINVSLDCGTADTFYKIKGLDAFDKVVNNLRKYAESGDVILKYIMIPGKNENVKDIDEFVKIAKSINAVIMISYDLTNGVRDETRKANTAFSENTFAMILYLYHRGLEENLKFTFSYDCFRSTDRMRLENMMFPQANKL